MRKQIYLALKDRLKRLIIGDTGDIIMVSEQMPDNLKSEDKTPRFAIKHVGLWNRQVEFIEDENIFKMPAVFVEFGKIEWRHQNGGLQDAELTIGLHVLTSAVPEGYDGDLCHLELLDNINRCLHGFQSDYIGSVERSVSLPCHDHEEVLDTTEVFKCVIYDDSAVKQLVSIKPDVNISTNQIE